MELDLTARRNLELTETLRGKEKKGTLLWVLDKTRTPWARGSFGAGWSSRSWPQRPSTGGSTPWRRWWRTPWPGS